jgi:hypothetical protein
MDLKKFRTAVNKGRKTMAENSKKTKEFDIVMRVVGADGEEQELKTTVFIKKFTGKDFEDFHALQYDFTDPDNPKTLCSRYTAATICGCLDKHGNRVFSADDIDFLEHGSNAGETLRITAEVFSKSELSEDIRDAKKQK